MVFRRFILLLTIFVSLNTYSQNRFFDKIFLPKQIIIEDNQGNAYTGDVFSIIDSKFLLGNSQDSVHVLFNLDEISKVDLKGGGSFFKGALIGFAAGTAFTTTIMLASGESEFGYLFVFVAGEVVFAIPAGIVLGTLSELKAINIEFENKDSIFHKENFRKYLQKHEDNNLIQSFSAVKNSSLLAPNNQIDIKKWKTPFYKTKFDIWFGAGLRQNLFQNQISKEWNKVGFNEEVWIFDNQDLMNVGLAYHITDNWRLGFEHSNEFVQRYTAQKSIDGLLYPAHMDFISAQYTNIIFADYIWTPVQRILTNRHELKTGFGLFLNKTWYDSSLSGLFELPGYFVGGESSYSVEELFYGLQLRAIYDFFVVSNVSFGINANLNLLYNNEIRENLYYDQNKESYIGIYEYPLNFSSLFLWAHVAVHF